MAMAYASQANAQPTFGTSITVAKPSGVVSGDVLVAIIDSVCSSAFTITPPSGWTDRGVSQNSAHRAQVFTRVAGGSEPANYTWTTSQTITAAIGLILRYTPQLPTTPPGVVDAAAIGSSATPAVAPSVDATGNNDTLVALFFSAGTLGSTPSGMTQRAAIDAGTPAVGAYDQLLTNSGATGTRTWTGSATGYGWSIALLANQEAGNRIRMMV